MSYTNFGNINKKESIFISGYTYIDGLSEQTRGTEEITIDSAKEFLNFLENSKYKKQLLSNLQSMSEKDNKPLLTTWFDSIDDFYQFLKEGQNCAKLYSNYDGYKDYPKTLVPLFQELEQKTKNWEKLGVNEIYIEGYKLR